MSRRTNAKFMRAALLRPVRLLGLAAGLLVLALTALPPASAQRRGGAEPRYSRPASRPRAQRDPYRGNRGYGAGSYPARPYARGFRGENRGWEGRYRGYREQQPQAGYGRNRFYGRRQPYGGAAGNYGRQPYGGRGENYLSPQQVYGRGAPYGAAQADRRSRQPYARPYPSRPYGSQPYARPDAGQEMRPGYSGAGNIRPAMPPSRQYSFPPGHLGSWLNQHRDMPVQGQEQLLRSNPSFRQLPASDQQRLMRQLQQVDRMPEQQRERRLARAELIEHMSPQERMQLHQSSRQLRQLPADRQALVKRAFQDLSAVPVDQRQTVLDSQRYQSIFSPQERNILGNLLRAEPYEPAP